MLQDTKIKVFLSLARTLSFTNTAKELFLSQQAVSKNIASLEERLGFSLFIRTSRSVTLTAAGERYYQALLEISRIYNEALIEIGHMNEREYQSFRVGYQNFLDLGSTPNRALEKLRKEYPELSVDSVRYSPLMLNERLLNGSCNLIVINGRFAPDEPGLRQLELLKSPQAVMISPENPLVTPSATYATFVNEPFIVDTFENESPKEYEQRVQKEIRMWGLSPKEVIWSPDRDSSYTLAEMGRGIVVGTEMSRVARDRNLKKYYTGKMDTLLAIWREEEENELVEKFALLLQQEFELLRRDKKIRRRKNKAALQPE